MQRRYITVDVFTDRAFGGNPLAVVLDADGLSTAQMQAIATEFNYSRDHLCAAAGRSGATTPGSHLHREPRRSRSPAIPMSAPPSCWRRRRQNRRLRLKFEEKAGLVPVEILTEQGKVVGAELTAPQPLKRLNASRRRTGRGVHLAVGADLKTDRHPPQIVSVGLPFLWSSRLARRAAARQA